MGSPLTTNGPLANSPLILCRIIQRCILRLACRAPSEPIPFRLGSYVLHAARALTRQRPVAQRYDQWSLLLNADDRYDKRACKATQQEGPEDRLTGSGASEWTMGQ